MIRLQVDGPNDSDSDEDDDDDDDDLNDLSHDDDPEGEDKAQVSLFNKICVEQDPGLTPPCPTKGCTLFLFTSQDLHHK